MRDALAKAAWAVGTLARGGLPDTLFAYGAGIGDDLLLTAVFRERAGRGLPPAHVMSRYPALFAGNPDVARVWPFDPRLIPLMSRLGRPVILPFYGAERDEAADRTVPPSCHIIGRMCELSGVTGAVSLRPYLHLTEAERAAGRLSARQVAIQSAGLAARFPMRNKQWGADRFQAACDALAGDFDLVQVGDPSDPPLSGARDLRGRTGLRGTAALLAGSLCFVGQVGFPMHLARAVGCRSVIVYGGRERPDQTGYVANENLYTPLACAPCWRENACDFGRACLSAVTPAHVAGAARRQAERARAGEPLTTETYDIAER